MRKRVLPMASAIVVMFSSCDDSAIQDTFYADPDNQTPQGPARRRNAKLTELVPVRFPPETLDKIRDAAGADDRSVS